ncbi:hypothetical protein ACFL6D_00665 [Spirochaetota bacterium]
MRARGIKINRILLAVVISCIIFSCRGPKNYFTEGRLYFLNEEYNKALDYFEYIINRNSKKIIDKDILLHAYLYKAKILFLKKEKIKFYDCFHEFSSLREALYAYTSRRDVNRALSFFHFFSSLLLENASDEKKSYIEIKQAVEAYPLSNPALLRLAYYFLKYNKFKKYHTISGVIRDNALDEQGMEKDEKSLIKQLQLQNDFLYALKMKKQAMQENIIQEAALLELSHLYLCIGDKLFRAYQAANAGKAETAIALIKEYYTEDNITRKELSFSLVNSPFMEKIVSNDEYQIFLDSFLKSY